MAVAISGKMLAAAAVAVAVVSIASGLFLIEGPEEQRAYRRDQQRLNDIGEIWTKLGCHYTRQGELPQALDYDSAAATPSNSLLSEFCEGAPKRDPSTGKPYEYRRTGKATFELCATFERESRGESVNLPWTVYKMNTLRLWRYKPGRSCVELSVRLTDGEGRIYR